MVASYIKEIKMDWLHTVPKFEGGKLSKLRKRVFHTAYEVVIHYSVAAKI